MLLRAGWAWGVGPLLKQVVANESQLSEIWSVSYAGGVRSGVKERWSEIMRCLVFLVAQAWLLGHPGPSAFLRLHFALLLTDFLIDKALLLALFASSTVRHLFSKAERQIAEQKTTLTKLLNCRPLHNYASYTLSCVRDPVAEFRTLVCVYRVLETTGYFQRVSVYACARVVARLEDKDPSEIRDLLLILARHIFRVNEDSHADYVRAVQKVVPLLVPVLGEVDKLRQVRLTWYIRTLLCPPWSETSEPLKRWMCAVLQSGRVSDASLFVLNLLSGLRVGMWGSEMERLVIRILPELVLEPSRAVFVDQLLGTLFATNKVTAEVYKSTWFNQYSRALRQDENVKMNAPGLPQMNYSSLTAVAMVARMSQEGLLNVVLKRFKDGQGTEEVLHWLGAGLAGILNTRTSTAFSNFGNKSERAAWKCESNWQREHRWHLADRQASHWRLQRQLVLRDTEGQPTNPIKKPSQTLVDKLQKANLRTDNRFSDDSFEIPACRRLTLPVYRS